LICLEAATISLLQVLNNVLRFEHSASALFIVVINEIGDHHPATLFNELLPFGASLANIVQQIRNLQLGKNLSHQAAVRCSLVAVEFNGCGLNVCHILATLLASDSTEASEERSEEAAQPNEGHAEHEGDVAVAVGPPEIRHDVPGAVQFPISVLIDEERELLLSANLYGLSAPLLAAFRARQDDAVEIQHGQGLPHQTAVGIALEVVQLEVLGRSVAEGLPHREAGEESDQGRESRRKEGQARDESPDGTEEPGRRLVLLLLSLPLR